MLLLIDSKFVVHFPKGLNRDGVRTWILISPGNSICSKMQFWPGNWFSVVGVRFDWDHFMPFCIQSGAFWKYMKTNPLSLWLQMWTSSGFFTVSTSELLQRINLFSDTSFTIEYDLIPVFNRLFLKNPRRSWSQVVFSRLSRKTGISAIHTVQNNDLFPFLVKLCT